MVYSVSGGINTGKDEVVNMLSYILSSETPNFEDYSKGNTKINGNISNLKFAKKVKEMVACLLDMTYEDMNDDLVKNEEVILGGKSFTVRELQISLANEWGRDIISPKIWVETSGIKKYKEGETIFLNSDLRFIDEIEVIKDYPSYNILLKRPFLERFPEEKKHGETIYDYPQDLEFTNPKLFQYVTNISERPLSDDLFDFVLYNDSDLKGLFNKLKNKIKL